MALKQLSLFEVARASTSEITMQDPPPRPATSQPRTVARYTSMVHLAEGSSWKPEPIRSALDAVNLMEFYFRGLDREHMIAIQMNSQLYAIGYTVVSIGSLHGTFVHPRETFKVAIMQSASSIILMHNHPSGDPTPSPEDKVATRRIASVGYILGIPLDDHIIVGFDPVTGEVNSESFHRNYPEYLETQDPVRELLARP